MRSGCREVERLLLGGFDLDEAARRHIDGCADCRAEESMARELADAGAAARAEKLDEGRMAVLRGVVGAELWMRRVGLVESGGERAWSGWFLRVAAVLVLCGGCWIWMVWRVSDGVIADRTAVLDVAAEDTIDEKIEELGLELSDSLRSFEDRHLRDTAGFGQYAVLGEILHRDYALRSDRW